MAAVALGRTTVVHVAPVSEYAILSVLFSSQMAYMRPGNECACPDVVSMANISLSSKLVVLAILLTMGLPICVHVWPTSVDFATTMEAPEVPEEFCEISM